MNRFGRALIPGLPLAITVLVLGVEPAFGQEPQDTIPQDTIPQDTIPQDTISKDTVFELRGIRARVGRPVATVGGASAVTAKMDSIGALPSPTIEDVLRDVPLILIQENSRGEAQPTLRGAESRQIAVLVDGVPITIGWDNRTDLSVVPLTAARELTMVRGLSSVLDGPNALGGVVKVGIASGPSVPMQARPVELTASVDHIGSSAVALTSGSLVRDVADGDVLVRAGLGYRQRDDYPRPSGVEDAIPGTDGRRINSDFEQSNGFLVARYEAVGGSWASLSTFGHRAEKGVPPELHISDPRLWRIPATSRWVTALSAGTPWGSTPFGGEGDLEASLGLDFGETEIDTYESLAYDSITGGEVGKDRTLSLRLLGDHTLGPGTLHGALTLAETRHVEILEPGGRSVFKQRLWSFGLEMEQPFLRDDRSAPRGRVSLGVSVDGASHPKTGGRQPRAPITEWGARLGGTYALGGGSVLLHGGASRRVRFPALRELFSGALGKFVVNPELAPEVLTVFESGTTLHLGGLEAQVVGFHQRLTDAIVRTAVGDGRLQRVNRDRVLSTGVEVLANYELDAVSLDADLTLQNVELEDPTAPANEREPEHQPSIRGGVGLTISLPLDVRVGGRIRHLGRQYCVDPDLGRQVAISPDSWGDLRISRAFDLRRLNLGQRVETTLGVENVTDASVFDQCGLPQPGRLIRFQVRVF